MPGAATPPNLLAAIASAAGGSYITNPMPEDPTGSNAASVTGGFPPITMESELSGGEPPLGQDFNGLFFLLSSHTLYVECGQLYLFNSTLAAAIGGYKAGTILGMSDGTGMWLNTTDGNTTNPDTGGAGWVPMAAYGFGTINTTGGTVAATLAQSKYPVLIITGALASNAVIQLPQTLQGRWLVINNTTGAFSVTVSTAAGGANVAIPQSGYAAPVPIYAVGDGNIYPQSAAANLPSYSQSPTGLTLAQRTNAGYILATYFNQSSSSSENPTIGAVFVENTAADGYLRKSALSNFVGQISPLLAQLQLTQNLASGYIKFPAGSDGKQLIVQWGLKSGGSGIVNFPIAFTTAVGFAIAATTGRSGVASDGSGFTYSVGLTSMGVVLDSPGTGFWLAIGY